MKKVPLMILEFTDKIRQIQEKKVVKSGLVHFRIQSHAASFLFI